MYACNFYNIIIPVPETEEFLLYNTLTGGIEILSMEEGIVLSELSSLKSFDPLNYPQNKSLIKRLLSKDYINVQSARSDVQHAEEIYTKHITQKKKENIYLTIGSTIVCNMSCPYCFEFVKPNLTLKDREIIEKIKSYLLDLFKKNKEIEWNTFMVTWYGGEPLINASIIEKLSPFLYDLARQHGMRYQGEIITNGIYLDNKNCELLEKSKVNIIQVTLDGAREVHDRNRPLKSKGPNYFRILENLKNLPDTFSTNIRINVDRKVAESFDQLFADLAAYGIWPDKHRSFSFTPAWLKTYDGEKLSEDEKKNRLTVDEYFEVLQSFRKKQVEIFNTWGKRNNVPEAKLDWKLPEYQTDCPTYASPFGLVIDPLGNVHKCWETIHDKNLAATNVAQGYNVNHFKNYTNFNRYALNEVCRNCKFLPVCDKVSCVHEARLHDIPQCTPWKYKAESFIREQYLTMVDTPSLISTPKGREGINTGHSNK